MNDALHQEIAELRRENDELRAQLDVIRTTQESLSFHLSRIYKLPPKCADLLAILMSGRLYFKQQLYEMLWDESIARNCHTVAMHTIRQRIPWLTLNASSRGSPFATYQLSKEDIDRLKAESSGH